MFVGIMDLENTKCVGHFTLDPKTNKGYPVKEIKVIEFKYADNTGEYHTAYTTCNADKSLKNVKAVMVKQKETDQTTLGLVKNYFRIRKSNLNKISSMFHFNTNEWEVVSVYVDEKKNKLDNSNSMFIYKGTFNELDKQEKAFLDYCNNEGYFIREEGKNILWHTMKEPKVIDGTIQFNGVHAQVNYRLFNFIQPLEVVNIAERNKLFGGQCI